MLLMVDQYSFIKHLMINKHKFIIIIIVLYELLNIFYQFIKTFRYQLSTLKGTFGKLSGSLKYCLKPNKWFKYDMCAH